ncbi:acyl-coenzyme A oxidase-like protein [Ictidomys tridecemlineatus]
MEPAQDLGLGDSSLHRYLDGEFWSLKNELRRLLGGCPLFRHRYGLSLDEMRALTVQRVKFILGHPLIKRAFQEQAEKTKNFVSRGLVIGEVLSTADLATSVKCGIIYWLFGGAVRNLGSPRHVTQWLQPLKEQQYTGMFAMTERGHGSNVRGIQTEATFDLVAQEFVIHTPCENAQKMYIGNAMCGNYAAVFAQLIINGSSQGPHCFIVPIRDENGSLYPGVTAIDMMHKEGLHGVDNGILIFNKVRVPRENLLDKFGSVAPDGQYHSPIKNKSARFNAMLATLTPSRLAVTFQALSTMKWFLQWAQLGVLKSPVRNHRTNEAPGKPHEEASKSQGKLVLQPSEHTLSILRRVRTQDRCMLVVAAEAAGRPCARQKPGGSLSSVWGHVAYGVGSEGKAGGDLPGESWFSMSSDLAHWRQFGPKAKEEVRIIEHQTQTLRLMPHLATVLALTFTSRYAGALLDEDIFQGKELVSSCALQVLMAGLKAYSTWENVGCLQDCHESTGGMGYMMENRISDLKCDADVFVTFEGDNVIMLQVVARELLAQYTKQHKDQPLDGLLWSWVTSVSDKLRTSFLAFNTDAIGNLTFLLKAVNFRERVLQRCLVARIYYKLVS